jgi:hypothetical protein
MAEVSQTIKSAIKGSIANPEAALAVIAKLEEAGLEPAENVAQILSPDATDLASAITLANETKAQVNALIDSLIAAGLMAAS